MHQVHVVVKKAQGQQHLPGHAEAHVHGVGPANHLLWSASEHRGRWQRLQPHRNKIMSRPPKASHSDDIITQHVMPWQEADLTSFILLMLPALQYSCTLRDQRNESEKGLTKFRNSNITHQSPLPASALRFTWAEQRRVPEQSKFPSS